MKIATLPLAALVAAPLAAQDTIYSGFESSQVSLAVDGEVRTLSDGRYITFDGQVMDLWDEDGTFLLNLGQLPYVGNTGAMVVSPGESFVLFGELLTGNVYRVEIDGSGVQTIGNLPRSRSAEFEDAQNVLISAGTFTGGPGAEIWRLNVPAKTFELLATVSGAPGPISVDSQGNAIYGRISNTAPPPADSSYVLRFKQEDLVPLPDPVYDVEGSVLVMQMESQEPVGDWVEATDEPGFTGDSFFRWEGPDFFNTPGNGTLTWEFDVDDPGDYRLQLYNLHTNPDDTLENDCWVRVDNGPWEKVFSGFDFPNWNWDSFIDPDVGDPYTAVYDLGLGEHTIQISGRSNNFMIDRFHLYKQGTPSALSLALPQTYLQVALTEDDASVLASGYDGCADIDVSLESDTIFVAERNEALGSNAIHAFGKAFSVEPILVDAGTSGTFEGLDFVPQNDIGFYFPWQPPSNGDLYYTRRDAISGALERRLLDTERPELALSGPGTSGLGAVTLSLSGGPPNGNAFLLYALPSSVNPTEQALFFDDLPFVVQTPITPSQAQILFFPLPITPTGQTALSFSNSFGTDILAFQMVLLTPGGGVVGSSTTVVL